MEVQGGPAFEKAAQQAPPHLGERIAQEAAQHRGQFLQTHLRDGMNRLRPVLIGQQGESRLRRGFGRRLECLRLDGDFRFRLLGCYDGLFRWFEGLFAREPEAHEKAQRMQKNLEDEFHRAASNP